MSVEVHPGMRMTLLDHALRLGIGLALTYLTYRVSKRLIESMNDDAESRNAKLRAKVLLRALGVDERLELDSHELQIASQLVLPQHDGVDWADVGGCERVVREITDRVILPLRLPSGKRSPLLAPPKGVLLYGPPGCGKTLIARAVARAAGARFINLQVSTLTSKWYGDTQKLTHAIFSLAQKLQPTIIFIDEIDSLLRGRAAFDHEATAMMKAQFMSLWDGFAADGAVRVTVVGATNRPRDVDAAILRRMPARFRIPLPDATQRVDILRILLRDETLDGDVDLDEVASETADFSGSDLKEACRLAVVSSARHLLQSTADDWDAPPLTRADLLDAVVKIQESAELDVWSRALHNDSTVD